jgi:hypothetical protein
MATPIVVGCCAVIRSVLRSSLPSDVTSTVISSAIIKAVLVNGTTDIAPFGVPQRTGRSGTRAVWAALLGEQEFDMVNLAKSLLCVPSVSGGSGGVYPTVSGVPRLGEGGRTAIPVRSPASARHGGHVPRRATA